MRSRNRRLGRLVAAGRALACAGAVLALALAVGGCREPQQRQQQARIAQAPPRTHRPPDLEEVVQQVMTNAGRWRTLDARCTVIIRSDYLRGEDGEMSFRNGRLRIQKPGKIMLRVPARGEAELELIGDGQRYEINMPIFRERYSARYGSDLPEGRLRILFMPDDVVAAFDYTALFRDKVQVLRQDGPLYAVDSLLPLSEPEPGIYMHSSIGLLPGAENVFNYRRYRPDGSMRTEIRYLHWDLFQADDTDDERAPAVSVPTRVWMAYGPGRTSIMLMLEDVRLNRELDPEQFRAGR